MRLTPEPGDAPASGRWFEPLADFLGPAYLRYSFTKGTEQEVAFLADVLGLAPGERVLDVGCGPGRHTRALAERGVAATGLDISERFVGLAAAGAPAGATFVRGDARRLPFPPVFDAVISLCQGGFGLLGGIDDGTALVEMASVLRPGGRLAVSAFSAYFQVRYLEDTDTFDAAAGVNHEVTELRNEAGERVPAELWTTCFTPRELRLLAAAAGLEVEAIWSVTPGRYGRRPPDLDHPELLLVARR